VPCFFNAIITSEQLVSSRSASHFLYYPCEGQVTREEQVKVTFAMCIEFSWGGFVNMSPHKRLYTISISLPWIGRHWLLHQHYNSRHRGHMWSPCDLISQLTSLFTPAHTKAILIIDTCSPNLVFEENERGSAEATSIVIVKVDSWESCSSFVAMSSCRETVKRLAVCKGYSIQIDI